jgi:hypothetical protein
MISEQQFAKSALFLDVEIAAIKAVAEVESGGGGFTTVNGTSLPVILFEPHIFWKQLMKVGKKPVESDICYVKWGTKPYPKGQVAQHERLKRAMEIHSDAALQSTSWGKFQIMGFNYSSCGCVSLKEFIDDMYKDEDAQLHRFSEFIKKKKLDKELRSRNWAAFAKGYNGAAYLKNKYDTKLATAYVKFKSQLPA